MSRGSTEITQVSAAATTTTMPKNTLRVEKKAQQAKVDAARREAARKARVEETRRDAEYRTKVKVNMKRQRKAAMEEAQALEKRQRDAVMKQKADANAKKAAAQKAEAIRMANKVVFDAEKHTEAVKRAKEVKKSAEMKKVAQANIEAAETKRNEQAAAAAKAERDRLSTFSKNKQAVQKRLG